MARSGDVCCMIISCCVLLGCCPLRHSLRTTRSAPKTCLHHPSPAQLLQETLQEEDHKYGVRLLPADRQVSAFLQHDETQR